MNYRDDREALRNQVESLQQELENERAEKERLASIEQRLDAARREMREAEAQLARVRGRRRSRSATVVAASVVLVAGAMGFWLFMRAPVPPRGAARVVTAPATLSPPRTPEATAMPMPPPPPEAPPKPTRKAHATWSATVTHARGVALTPGARCTIEADVLPDASGMHVDGVEVRCGATKLYSERDPLSGMSMVDSGATQRAGAKAGTFVYALSFSDHGERGPSRNQAQLDSTAKVGKVWSDNLPETRVDLAIQPDSAPVDVAVAN